MSVNPHDDYEKLAKLLYPSIEASGNVYYGQTRKLTLDEVLKRNSLGFDSHIESFYNDNGYYDSYFCWRLGSLHGSILVDPFVDSITVNNFSVDFIKRILYADSEEIIYDNNLIYAQHLEDSNTLHTSTIPIFGTIFAKYRLDKHSTTITNELNSGSYDSYEFDVEPVLDGIYVTDDFNPVNSIDDNISERHFYISKENGIDYLYIQILTSKDTSKILTFTALKDSEISLSMGQPSDGFRVVEYRVSQGGVFPDTWETYHYDWIATAAPTGPISLSSGQRIQFRSDIENAVLFNNTEYCLKFVINSGKVFVSGSCMSMCHPDIDESTITSLENYALYGLFSGVENMYGTPMLPNIRKLGIGCYNSMFSNCTSLTVAPKLKSSVTYDTDHIDNSYCYSNMFNGCISLVSPPKMMGYDSTDQDYHSGVGTCHNMFVGCKNLKSSPVIRYKTLDSYSCYQMFSGCSSLKIIQCGAKYILNSATTLWVNNVPSKGTFIKSSANYYSNVNGIPTGWTSITKDDEYFAVHKDPEVGFRIDKHIPNGNYKNDYLVTSGTDSETNGRGYIDSHSNTLGNMECSFDENGTHKMNTYNSDGSFNQEIWGYKSFNSPVQFRNGIYGETAKLIASTAPHCTELSGFTGYGGGSLPIIKEYRTELKGNEYNDSNTFISIASLFTDKIRNVANMPGNTDDKPNEPCYLIQSSICACDNYSVSSDSYSKIISNPDTFTADDFSNIACVCVKNRSDYIIQHNSHWNTYTYTKAVEYSIALGANEASIIVTDAPVRRSNIVLTSHNTFIDGSLRYAFNPINYNISRQVYNCNILPRPASLKGIYFTVATSSSISDYRLYGLEAKCSYGKYLIFFANIESSGGAHRDASCMFTLKYSALQDLAALESLTLSNDKYIVNIPASNNYIYSNNSYGPVANSECTYLECSDDVYPIINKKIASTPFGTTANYNSTIVKFGEFQSSDYQAFRSQIGLFFIFENISFFVPETATWTRNGLIFESDTYYSTNTGFGELSTAMLQKHCATIIIDAYDSSSAKYGAIKYRTYIGKMIFDIYCYKKSNQFFNFSARIINSNLTNTQMMTSSVSDIYLYDSSQNTISSVYTLTTFNGNDKPYYTNQCGNGIITAQYDTNTIVRNATIKIMVGNYYSDAMYFANSWYPVK